MLFGLWLRQIWMPHFCLSDIVHQVLRVYCLTWAYEITLIYLYPPWLYWMAKLLQPCLNLGEYISSGDCRSFYHVDIVYMMLNLFFSSAGRRAVSLLMRVSVCWSCQGHYPSFSVLTILWFFPEHRCFFFFWDFADILLYSQPSTWRIRCWYDLGREKKGAWLACPVYAV